MEARQVTTKINLSLSFPKLMPSELIVQICLMINDPAAIKLVMFIYLLQTQSSSNETTAKFQRTWHHLNLFHHPKSLSTATISGFTEFKQSIVETLPTETAKKLFRFITWNNLAGIQSFKLDENLLLNIKNSQGRNAIQEACHFKRESIIEYFYAIGLSLAKAKPLSWRRYSPIHWAAACGLLDEVQRMVSNDSSCLTRFGRNFELPMEIAIIYGHLDIVQFFHSYLLTTGVLGHYGIHLLCLAAENNHLAITEFLIRNGAPVNALNEAQEKPLFSAVKGGNLEIIQTLVKAGATLESTSNSSGTLAHVAATYNHPLVLQYLIDNKQAIDEKNLDGETPLFKAVQKGHLELVKLLLAQNADVNNADNKGKTIVLAAIENGRFEILKLLLASGANVYLTKDSVSTMCAFAKKYKHPEIIPFLHLWAAFKNNAKQSVHQQIKSILLTSLDALDKFQNSIPIKMFNTKEKKLISLVDKCSNETDLKNLMIKNQKKIDSDKYDFIMQFILSGNKLTLENSAQLTMK